MSVVQVRALKCDHPGCDESITRPEFMDAISVRMAGAREGWTYRQPTKGPTNRGPKRNSADFCPKHPEERP